MLAGKAASFTTWYRLVIFTSVSPNGTVVHIILVRWHMSKGWHSFWFWAMPAKDTTRGTLTLSTRYPLGRSHHLVSVKNSLCEQATQFTLGSGCWFPSARSSCSPLKHVPLLYVSPQPCSGMFNLRSSMPLHLGSIERSPRGKWPFISHINGLQNYTVNAPHKPRLGVG